MHSPRRSVISRNGKRRGEERRKAGAGNVAVGVAAIQRAISAERHAALPRRERRALRRLFEIEQAQIILAALAHDRLVFALDRIGIKPRHLLHDLALQIARVGREPQPRAVLLRPQACRREIAQRLADAGARFDAARSSARRPAPRGERICRCFGIGPLFEPRSRRSPTSCASRVRVSSLPTGSEDGWGRRFVFPFGQAVPGGQRGERREVFFGCADSIDDRRSPSPSRVGEQCGERPQTRALGSRKFREVLRAIVPPLRAERAPRAAAIVRIQAQRAREPKRARTNGTAGRTKAKSSSTSNSGLAGAVRRRPATNAAFAISTSPERNSARASSIRQRGTSHRPARALRRPATARAREWRRGCSVADSALIQASLTRSACIAHFPHEGLNFSNDIARFARTCPRGPRLALRGGAQGAGAAGTTTKAGLGKPEAVIFETGYGPSGLPHIGTFGEVARTTWVRRAFELMSDVKTRLIRFPTIWTGCARFRATFPTRRCCANIWASR